MNKMIKGSIAGAAGVALLAGGFGSYALWQDTAQLPSSTVSSGVLTIDPDASSIVWADATGGEWEEGDLLVPGDIVTRTQTFNISGTGANLEGVITYAESTLGGTFSENLTVDVEVTSNDTEVTPIAGSPNDFEFSNPFENGTLTTVVTYKFDGDSVTGATGDVDQGKTATLPLSTFTISQS